MALDPLSLALRLTLLGLLLQPVGGVWIRDSTLGLAAVGLVWGPALNLWKGVLSPDFLDGRFFRVTLLIDPRFEAFVRLVTGLGADQVEWQRAALTQHADGEMVTALGGPEPIPGAYDRLAWLMTVWTWVIETLITILFCLPPSFFSFPARVWALLAFCATTYAVAPVAGFAWLLIGMGVAQSDAPRGRLRAL